MQRILGALALLAIVGACGPSSGGSDPWVGFWVSATTGSDANPGTFAEPWKTITAAAATAPAGAAIFVNAGTYDAANGEVFPILLPAGTTLVGDIGDKGKGEPFTEVVGDGHHPLSTSAGAVFDMQAGSTIAGLRIENPGGVSKTPMGVILYNDGCTVRQCTFEGNIRTAIYVMDDSQDHLILENDIVDNNWVGLGFIGGGVGSRVEANLIARNEIGVEYDSAGGDMGGGAAGSLGWNTISCNTRADLWTNAAMITIDAANNAWDHVPPNEGPDGGGIDIFNDNSATIVTTGARLALTPCP